MYLICDIISRFLYLATCSPNFSTVFKSERNDVLYVNTSVE